MTILDDSEDSKNAFEISGPMIESITVLCSQKDDRQQWIELLSQDQASSHLKSPTMSHVSSSSHLFARLSRLYARLVRKKIIYPELVKKLLYLQYIFKPDTGTVKMRRCIVTYSINPTISEDYESDEEDSSKKLQRSIDKPRVLLKSSLLLDVRYATETNDLRELASHSANLPLTGSTSSVNKPQTYKKTDFDTCQSLPNSLPCSSSQSETNLRHLGTRNLLLSSLQQSNNRIDQLKRWSPSLPSKIWKNEQPQHQIDASSSEFIHIGHLPTQLTTISENMLDTNDCGRDYNPQLLPITTSIHSSDSGMADSYHMTSSELNSGYKCNPWGKSKCLIAEGQSESENDENNFEHQCICSSPFGSTPRQSSGQSSESANNSFIGFTAVRRGIVNEANDNKDTEEIYNDDDDEYLGEDEIKKRHDNFDKKRFTAPLPYAHMNVCKRIGRSGSRPKGIRVEVEQKTEPVFKSGLYAHWWLKKTIPIAVEQGKLPWHGCTFFIFSFVKNCFLFIYFFK